MRWRSIRAGEHGSAGRSRPWRVRAGVSLVGACLALMVSGVATATPQGAVELGRAPARTRVALEIALRPRDPAALARAVQAVSNPASALYRHYLARGQFGRMFGPTRAAVAAVSGWLRRAGLRVGSVFDDDLLLPVSGTVGEAESAFGVRMRSLGEASAARVEASTSSPKLPSSVARFVQAVVGLDNLAPSVPVGLGSSARIARVPGGGTAGSSGPLATQAYGESAACKGRLGLTAGDIARAYDFDPLYASGDSGAGEAVDLFELSTFSSAAVSRYQKCYGTHVPVHTAWDDNSTDSDEIEADSDIEDVIGLDPGLSAINVYEAADTDPEAQLNTWGAIAKADDAAVVNTSFGDCENIVEGFHTGSSYPAFPAAEHSFFAAMVMQGQTVVAATGDSGSAGCPSAGLKERNVTDPASQPFVTAVGGTCFSNPTGSLTAPNVCDDHSYSTAYLGDPPLTAPSELGWGQSGGGVSALWRLQSYEKGPGVIERHFSSGAPCGNSPGYCREVPDVSADAGTSYAITVDDSSICYKVARPCWAQVRGTSLAAPTWAALAALIDDSSAGCRKKPVGFLNPNLYKLARSAPGDFNDDITSASLKNRGDTNGFYPVRAGYNMVTGLGSPVGANLAQSLCPRTLLHVDVKGSQVYGESAPKLTATYTAPKGVKVSGKLDCGSPVSLNHKSYLVSPTLAPGDYAVDAEDCTGLTDSKPGRYVLDYVGPHDGFVVSKDTTKVTLSVDHSSEPYGDEQAASFTVRVRTGHGEKLPDAATVDVAVGSTLCIATVKPDSGGGEGSCALGAFFPSSSGSATALPPGSYTATTVGFAGDKDLRGSGAASTAFTVTKDTTTTYLTVNPSIEPYGQESAASFEVAVQTTNREELPATEPATVTVGSASCVAQLAPSSGGGSGTCALSSGIALALGSYQPSASYAGDSDLDGSTHLGAGSSTSFDVTQVPVTVSVSGNQVYGSSSPSFSETNNAPTGITVSGTPICTSVGNPGSSTTIGPTLPVSSTYTILGSSCSGITLTGASAGDYAVVYQGVIDGFVVSPGIVTYDVPTSDASPVGITAGSDGALWFTESLAPAAIGRVSISGAFSRYPTPTTNSQPEGIALGPDGNLWFTEANARNVAKITTSGSITEFPVPSIGGAPVEPWSITSGPDNALWFTDLDRNDIDEIAITATLPDPDIHEFPIPTTGSEPMSITEGSDDNLWFVEKNGNKIGKMTPAGTFTEYPLTTAGSEPNSITAGPDDALWFAEGGVDEIGEITTAGVISQFPLPPVPGDSGADVPESITTGADGNLWFTMNGGPLGQMTPSGSVTYYQLPASVATGVVAGLTAGPDGNVWFTLDVADAIGEIGTG